MGIGRLRIVVPARADDPPPPRATIMPALDPVAASPAVEIMLVEAANIMVAPDLLALAIVVSLVAPMLLRRGRGHAGDDEPQQGKQTEVT